MRNFWIILLLSSLSWAARTFNGTTDYIDTGSYLANPTCAGGGGNNGAFNVSAFTNTTDTASGHMSIAQFDAANSAHDQFALYIFSGAARFLEVDGSFTEATFGSPVTNVWKNLSGSKPHNVSVGGFDIHVYYGGVDTSLHSASGSTLQCPTFTVSIGMDFNGASLVNPWSGKLADVAYWDFVGTNHFFSALEYTALQRGQPASQIAGSFLTHYWPLHGLASPEPDIKGQKNGTLHGTTSSFAPMNPEIPPVQGAY